MFLILILLFIFCVALYALNTWYRKEYIEDFHKKTVFITGTDSGFGKKLALDLDAQGLTVYAGCYTTGGADNLRKEASSRMRICQLDVTNRDSIIKAREFVQKDLPSKKGLWALVNNAGIAQGTLFETATIKDYRDVMDVNFYGGVQCVEEFLPLIKLERGRIINIVSILGRHSGIGGPYTSSKFAFEAYSDGLRRSLWPFGVKVSIIEPGFFKTNIIDTGSICNDVDKHWNQLSPEIKNQYGEESIEESKKRIVDFISNPTLSGFNRIEHVTKSIEHAIGSKRPKVRYVVGLDAHIIYRPLSVLPDGFTDVLFYLKGRTIINIVKKRNQRNNL